MADYDGIDIDRWLTRNTSHATTLTVTIPVSRGFVVALQLLWLSLVGLFRRSGVTFEVRGD